MKIHVCAIMAEIFPLAPRHKCDKRYIIKKFL
jgi:hypothetical protein